MSPNSTIGLAELLAVEHVLARLLERRLCEAAGATAGLQPSGREAAHLQVEALAESARPADEILRRHEVVLELQRERVHAAVAGRRVGLAAHLAAAGLRALEVVAAMRLLLDDEERQALRTLAHVGIGAQQQREHVGAARERAPRLRAVHDVAVDAADGGALGAALHARDVAADVRLGHRDAHHDLAGGDLRAARTSSAPRCRPPSAPW